ncbi:putative Mn2+ efflux pump MntP [Erythromicrobium ramosum]|uniref:Putative manganese efflux pump MntP n=1 Tax=Erythrobacter ramosus TaxID=35811 RepID=A0A6I4UGM9_9SPHN|nr:manganese efflux pump MntP family protein [Erythrobacter ramosus]MBB3774272.1 putative Mn2+ efflux pump MntP [Erythrobacter ramosus]MXP38070.1 manganese efflux pump MntP [Erythrobacter ramosus]
MIEALLLAVALAMDAFAVALTQGAKFRPSLRGGLAIALTFGVFQALMPLAGWVIGAVALIYVEAVDHWIAFGLLTFLGVRMLGGHVGDEEAARALTGRTLLIAGVATSIDALAAGITLPALGVSPWLAVALIGIVTFVMSGAGVALGRRAGDHLGEWAERAGGIILIGLGVKILAEHSGYF